MAQGIEHTSEPEPLEQEEEEGTFIFTVLADNLEELDMGPRSAGVAKEKKATGGQRQHGTTKGKADAEMGKPNFPPEDPASGADVGKPSTAPHSSTNAP